MIPHDIISMLHLLTTIVHQIHYKLKNAILEIPQEVMYIKTCGLKFPCVYILQSPKISFYLPASSTNKLPLFHNLQIKFLFTALHMQSHAPHTNLMNYEK